MVMIVSSFNRMRRGAIRHDLVWAPSPALPRTSFAPELGSRVQAILLKVLTLLPAGLCPSSW